MVLVAVSASASASALLLLFIFIAEPVWGRNVPATASGIGGAASVSPTPTSANSSDHQYDYIRSKENGFSFGTIWRPNCEDVDVSVINTCSDVISNDEAVGLLVGTLTRFSIGHNVSSVEEKSVAARISQGLTFGAINFTLQQTMASSFPSEVGPEVGPGRLFSSIFLRYSGRVGRLQKHLFGLFEKATLRHTVPNILMCLCDVGELLNKTVVVAEIMSAAEEAWRLFGVATNLKPNVSPFRGYSCAGGLIWSFGRCLFYSFRMKN
jgi:hypothetical protein